jgi:hypothetical protein
VTAWSAAKYGIVLHQGAITSTSNEPATTVPCAAASQFGSTLSLGTLSASRYVSCLKCRPAWYLDVNFQEVVHSIRTGNADVAKPQ